MQTKKRHGVKPLIWVKGVAPLHATKSATVSNLKWSKDTPWMFVFLFSLSPTNFRHSNWHPSWSWSDAMDWSGDMHLCICWEGAEFYTPNLGPNGCIAEGRDYHQVDLNMQPLCKGSSIHGVDKILSQWRFKNSIAPDSTGSILKSQYEPIYVDQLYINKKSKPHFLWLWVCPLWGGLLNKLFLEISIPNQKAILVFETRDLFSENKAATKSASPWMPSRTNLKRPANGSFALW